MLSTATYRWVLETGALAALLLGHPLSSQAPSKALPAAVAPQVNPLATASPATTDRHALAPDDLGAFLDGFIPLQLHRENIAGAVVMVVKDGKVLYQHGYGYADVDKKILASTEATLFRPGSISKLFTWTAVMQQVEQGKINLDEDVNDYLDFKIPNTFARPITMRNLMTHTAGFEESIKDLITTASNPPKLRDYLIGHLPQRVYPPGTTPAYSNYGAGLAAYIVQRVSGVPFDEYVEKNIFTPLKMSHTSFRQPLPAGLKTMVSQGYPMASEEAKPFEMIDPAPAGSLTTSAVDISHFMLAQLQGGEYEGAKILSPATLALMHSAQFAVDPVLPHMCLGFYEETRNGHRIIGHAGDLQYFHSDLHLMQDQDLGFFISYNSAGRGEIDVRGALFRAFLDRYYPYQVPGAAVQANASQDAQLVSGEYITSRRPVTTILSLFGFIENSTVTPGKDGTILVSSLKGIDQLPKTWVEIGPLLYREKNGQNLVGFTRDSANRLVLSTDFPFEVATKVSLVDNKVWNFFLLGLITIVSFATLLTWPVAFWIRRHYKREPMLTPEQKRLWVAIRIVVALDACFVLCWIALFVASGGEPLFDAHLDPVFRLFQLVGWLGSLGTLVALYAIVRTWRAPGEWWLSHACNAAIALSAISFSWFLLHWHMLNYSLRY